MMYLRFPQQYVAALNLLLIAITVYFLALAVSNGLKLHLVRIETTGISSSAAPRQLRETGPRPRAYYDTIVRRDIFSRAPLVPAPAPIANENLDVTLIGTSHVTGGKPFIIVETADGEQALYRQGETIPNVGRVLSISRNQAVVLHNGHRVALAIPNQEEGLPSRATPFDWHSRGFRSQRNFQRNFPRGRPSLPINPFGAPSSAEGVSRFTSNRYSIERTTFDRDLSNMGSLLTQIRAVPNVQNGSSNGYRLSQIQSGSIFQQIGLQNGDIVTGAEGQPVTDPMRAIALVSALRNSPSISISLIRNGSPLQLHYNIH
jgi:type II secretion system protein C